LEAKEALIGFLGPDPNGGQETLLEPVRETLEELTEGIRGLVVEQSALWLQSIDESRRQWQEWSGTQAERIDEQLGRHVGEALDRHAAALDRTHARIGQVVSEGLERHVVELGKLQDEGNRQQDVRWQQWQTTLSDQARLM